MAIPVFAHIAAASYLIPAGSGIRSWKRLPAPMKVFSLFCIYSFVHLLAEFVLGRMGISNLFLLDYHQIVELLCILFIYAIWIGNKRYKDLFQYLGLAYALLWMINMFYFEDPQQFSEVTAMTALFIQIVTSIIVLNALIRTSREPVAHHSIFWIALGVLLYAAGTIIVSGFSNTILAMGISYFNILWHINWGFTVIANILFARSFLCPHF
jgi:hypothetical protein